MDISTYFHARSMKVVSGAALGMYAGMGAGCGHLPEMVAKAPSRRCSRRVR